MSAPKHNTYHALRLKAGRGYTFKTPMELEQAFRDYFQWVDDHPLYRAEAVKSGPSVGQIIQVPVKRPYTEKGFCAYHGLGKHFLTQLKSSLAGKEDAASQAFSGVIAWAENLCDTDKFEGAVVGLYNANIISRDLGLKDTTQHELTGADGAPLHTQATSPVDYDQLPDEVLKAIVAARKSTGGSHD